MNRQQRRNQAKTMRKANSINFKVHEMYQKELVAERMPKPESYHE